jgi:hypothetical protein
MSMHIPERQLCGGRNYIICTKHVCIRNFVQNSNFYILLSWRRKKPHHLHCCSQSWSHINKYQFFNFVLRSLKIGVGAEALTSFLHKAGSHQNDDKHGLKTRVNVKSLLFFLVCEVFKKKKMITYQLITWCYQLIIINVVR